MSENTFEIKEYAVNTLPKYRQSLVEKLIVANIDSDMDIDDYDDLVCELFDLIVEGHLLDAHLRQNLQPESHD